MASTRPSVGSITSPSVTSRPSYQLSAPSNSDGAASSYYCAAIPPVPSKNVPEYPSKTATISRRNGDSTQQQPSTNGHQDRHSSLDSHSGGGAHAAPRLEVDTGIYSSRPAVSLRENERPPYDATGHAHKNEPKRDYWADRPQPVYLNGNPEAQDFRRYI
ncbi:hypothetical protein SEPCBS119000_000889 [Sporothrix epigloea]|uniref:Uncharacterized protein n=1 Tax=Sporothrix epigloea TaxID=1892477 RepID=A0ABP0D7P9_9PEZI